MVVNGRMVAFPQLLDVEAEHRTHPRTFSIPRRAVRESLVPGDLVKLVFIVDPPAGRTEAERMWVQVVGASGSGYVGRLDNDPDYLVGLKADDLLAFRPEHVAARWVDESDPSYIHPEALVIVSRRVWEGDAWPRRLEHADVPDPQFCGWLVFAGDEPTAYVADLANFRPVPFAELADRFRVLDSGFDGPVGTIMEWDDQSLEFVDVAIRPG